MADMIGLTGQNGFLGSHLKEELTREEFNLKGFDREKWDLLDYNSLKGFVQGCSTIVHLAGVNRGEEIDFLRVNAEGTFNLARAIRDSNPGCRIIFASSAQVYRPNKGQHIYSEKDRPNPLNIYGISKRVGEKLIEYCGIKHTILRFTNIYGEGCKPFYNSAIATFIELARKGEEIKLTCSPQKKIDFIYVKDAVRAIVKAMEKGEDGVFNIATGHPITMRDALEEIKKHFPELSIEEKGGDDKTILMDAGKAVGVLGFKPLFDFQEGLKRYVEVERNEEE